MIKISFGTEEGEECRRSRCDGILEYEQPRNCSCHLSSPCNSCINVQLFCPECWWSESDGVISTIEITFSIKEGDES